MADSYVVGQRIKRAETGEDGTIQDGKSVTTLRRCMPPPLYYTVQWDAGGQPETCVMPRQLLPG